MKNILSLFDWLWTWRIVLENLKMKDFNYFSSEIDKYAIAVSDFNFCNNIKLWNIIDIDVKRLKKYWSFHLLVWWSPCTNLSLAWKADWLFFKSLDDYLEKKKEGKIDYKNIKNESFLFWEYLRILKELQPKYFLLENVVMKEEDKKIFIKNLYNIEPILLNSVDYSSQSRKRLFWLWVKNDKWWYDKVEIKKIKSSHTILADIVFPINTIEEKYYLKNYSTFFWKDFPIINNVSYKGCSLRTRWNKRQELETRKDEKSNCLTTVLTDTLLKINFTKWNIKLSEEELLSLKKIYKNNEVKCLEYINEMFTDNFLIRKFHPLECERLQTLPLKQDSLLLKNNKKCRKKITIPFQETGIIIYHNFINILEEHNPTLLFLELLKEKGKIMPFSNYVVDNSFTFKEVKKLKTLKDKENYLMSFLYYFLSENDKRLFLENTLDIEVKLSYGFTKYWLIDNKIVPISNTQRYKMIGNGWTVEVIKELLWSLDYE